MKSRSRREHCCMYCRDHFDRGDVVLRTHNGTGYHSFINGNKVQTEGCYAKAYEQMIEKGTRSTVSIEDLRLQSMGRSIYIGKDVPIDSLILAALARSGQFIRRHDGRGDRLKGLVAHIAH